MLRAAHSQLTRAALAAPCASPALRRAFADAPAAFVTAAQLKQMMALPAASQPTLVDVREAEELVAAALPGATHLPLSKAAEWRLSSALDAKRPAVVLCQHGRARSVAGAAKLRAAGIADVKILEGGIEAYSAVDPSVPIYSKYTPTFKF